MSNIKIGKSATADTIVNEDNTAKTVGSGGLSVFATPMMIALMEQAAFECLEDSLEPGQTTVGTLINVSHTAASPPGAKITATATVDGIFERRIEFTVTASDNTGEIGTGKHTRFIVDAERLISKAQARI